MPAPLEDQSFRKDNQFHPDAISPEEFFRVEDLFRHDTFRVDFAHVVREGNHLKALLDVSYGVRSSGDNPTTQEQSRSLAYFDRPGMPTPAFTLAPTAGAQGFLQGMFAGISGLGVDFPGVPEFGNKFSVMTFFPKSTRALFNEKLQRSFLKHSGVKVQTGTGGRIAIYQDGLFSTQLERQEFLKVAEELAECIFESAALLKAADRPNGKEVIEAYQALGRLGPGKDSLVTSEDVNELLSQPSPRKIPKKILKKAYGGSAGFLAIGGFFAALGLFFSVLLSDGLALLFSSFVTLVGLSSIYLAMRYRQSKERLLRDGRCEAFKVKDVRASNTYENNTRVFFVTVVGVAGTILLNVHREAATMARTRKERGKPIKVLVDSVDPSKVLWVEAWAIDACINADISD